MNPSFFALSLIGLFLIFYLCLRPLYVRYEMRKMMTEINEEAEREEFPELIDAPENCVESGNDKDNYFNFRYHTSFTPDAGNQNF